MYSLDAWRNEFGKYSSLNVIALVFHYTVFVLVMKFIVSPYLKNNDLI